MYIHRAQSTPPELTPIHQCHHFLVCQGRAVLVLIPVEVEEALAMAAEWVAADAKAERTR